MTRRSKPCLRALTDPRVTQAIAAARRTLHRLRRVLAVLGLAIAPFATAHAQQPAPAEPAAAVAERARIAAERGRINAAYEAEQQRCFQRFAVTSCRNDSRRRRDADNGLLRKREIELNDAERARKAAVQRFRIEQRQRERVQREAETAEPAGLPGATAAPAARITLRAPGPIRNSAPKAPMAPRAKPREDQPQRRAAAATRQAQRVAQEAANVAQNERRLQEASEHKAEVIARNKARTKSAEPLSLPAAAEPR